MDKKNILTIILGIILIILTILVCLGYTESFDTFCYNLVTFKMNDTWTNIFKVITFLGSTLFIILACLFFFVFFILKGEKSKSFIVSSVVIISTILNNLIKVIIRRKRPLVLALVTEKSFSYPSGHMMASVSLYGILFYLVYKSNLNKKLKIFLECFLIILPILIGISRIYLGAHFASDILGAALTSLILLLIATNLIAKKNWL